MMLENGTKDKSGAGEGTVTPLHFHQYLKPYIVMHDQLHQNLYSILFGKLYYKHNKQFSNGP